MTEPTSRGLKGVVVGTTTISKVDGEAGRLTYRGYSIQDLAQQSNFEEVSYLLWHGRLPKREELADLQKRLSAEVGIPEGVVGLIRSLPNRSHPMDVLRTAVSALAGWDEEESALGREANLCKAIRLTAKTPTIIAAYDRIRRGLDPIPPDPNLPIASNFLQMLHGRPAGPEFARALDVILILHADHGFNASTFSARVTVSTEADMYAGVTSAIGTLKGPLHGGANQAVREMLGKIGDPRNADAWIKSELAQGRRIMGFGHRVYKTVDPRADILREMSENLGKLSGKTKWFEITRKLEDAMRNEKGGKLNPNVDLYSASCYECLDVDVDLYTTLFAAGRMPGWTAHVLEQLGDNQLIRPLADYQGELGLRYTPIDAR